MENELLTELEQKIGYQFKDKGLLKHAATALMRMNGTWEN